MGLAVFDVMLALRYYINSYTGFCMEPSTASCLAISGHCRYRLNSAVCAINVLCDRRRIITCTGM